MPRTVSPALSMYELRWANEVEISQTSAALHRVANPSNNSAVAAAHTTAAPNRKCGSSSQRAVGHQAGPFCEPSNHVQKPNTTNKAAADQENTSTCLKPRSASLPCRLRTNSMATNRVD